MTPGSGVKAVLITRHEYTVQLLRLSPAPTKATSRGHQPALPVSAVGAFIARLHREQKGLAAKALEFAILTAARDGEVRGATWSEIDLEAAAWTIPAGRMKASRSHRVPLSPSAVK